MFVKEHQLVFVFVEEHQLVFVFLEEHQLVSVFVFAEREFESGVSLHIRSISLSANSNATVLLAN